VISLYLIHQICKDFIFTTLHGQLNEAKGKQNYRCRIIDYHYQKKNCNSTHLKYYQILHPKYGSLERVPKIGCPQLVIQHEPLVYCLQHFYTSSTTKHQLLLQKNQQICYRASYPLLSRFYKTEPKDAMPQLNGQTSARI